jgi:two-component system OmpR family sensor kinase
MDGQQIKQRTSLKSKLYRWISITTFIFVLITTLLSGLLAFNEAKDLQDNLLHQVASLVQENQLNEAQNLIVKHQEKDEAIIIQYVNGESSQLLQLPSTLSEGIQTVDIEHKKWRILVSIHHQSQRQFLVAQQTEFRNEIAWNSSLNAFIPTCLSLIFTLIIISLIINNSFKPIQKLTRMLDSNKGLILSPLPDDTVFEEVAPFLLSINKLLDRAQNNLVKQQRFIADAAHELRTPVAALSILSENIQNAVTEADKQQRQQLLNQGFERLRLLVAQLLDLARLQSDYTSPTRPCSLNKIVQEVVAELYPLAEAKKLDIGILHNDKVSVLNQGSGLSQLVKNAIDNAIRYTPEGGIINISVMAESDTARFVVEDNGIGISDEDQDLLFEPFYRGKNMTQMGNGLGLTISHEIAQNLGGTLSVINRLEGGVRFQYIQKITTVTDVV